MHLHLIDPRQTIFNRVFPRNNLALRAVELGQGGRQARARHSARSRRTRRPRAGGVEDRGGCVRNGSAAGGDERGDGGGDGDDTQHVVADALELEVLVRLARGAVVGPDLGDGILDDDTLEAALIGTIGAVAAENLSSFVRFGRDICSFDRVVADPEKAPLSDNPSAQLIQVFQFVSRCDNREQAEAVVKYVWRMRAEMQSIFCNTVANSTRVALFATLNDFGKMLQEHKIFFSTK